MSTNWSNAEKLSTMMNRSSRPSVGGAPAMVDHHVPVDVDAVALAVEVRSALVVEPRVEVRRAQGRSALPRARSAACRGPQALPRRRRARSPSAPGERRTRSVALLGQEVVVAELLAVVDHDGAAAR